jgi:hypothetical protein
MAQTKIKLIADGVIDVNNLKAGHTITTDNIGEGTNLYYTDARVGSYLSANSYATEGYVTTAVSNLVDAAPSTLDTLNELAAALGDDPNFATTVTNSIATKLPLAGGTISGNLVVSGSLTGTLATAAQTNITSVGTLSSLAVSGAVNIADAQSIFFSGTGGDYGKMSFGDADPDVFDINFYQDSGLAAGLKFYALSEAAGGGNIDLISGGTTSVSILNNGNVGIGTNSPEDKLDVNGIIKISPTTPPALKILRNANIGNTASTGFIEFGGKDTTGYAAGATIVTIAEGAWSTTSHPARMAFSTTPVGGAAALERLRITSGGNIGIGTTSPNTIFNVNTDINNNGITLSGTSDNLRFNIKNNQVTAGQRAFSMMMSGSFPALIYQALGDDYGFIRNIMSIQHNGNIGIGTLTSSSLLHLTQDAPVLTSESTNGVSGFRINVLGGNSQLLRVQKEGTTKFQIDPNGAIYLGGSTAAANALDDYEEGTWTPSVGGNATYSFQRGSYTKVGRLVTVNFDLQISSIGTGSTTTLNLPFASGISFNNGGVTGSVRWWQSLTQSFYFLSCYVESNSASLNFVGTNSLTASTPSGGQTIFGNSARIAGTITYMT